MATGDIEARVIQKVATEAEWTASTILPREGEFMIVADSTGTPRNIKVGNGVDMYPALPYMFDSIQQNVGYVAITGFELPTPESDVAFSIVGEGTYTFGGSEAFTVPTGHLGVANWSSGAWSFVDLGELPVAEIDKTDAISSPSERVTTETAVINYATPLTSLRILPVGYIYIPDDRPDLSLYNVIIIDKNGNYLEQGSGSGSGDLPDGYEYLADDRPDLANLFIFLDANNYYIPSSADVDLSVSLDKILTYKYFGEMQGYPVETVKDTNEYWQLWENIRADHPDYISRTPMRNSSFLGLPNWRYDFRPHKPKIKIVLVGLSHGWEKNTSFGWVRFMDQLANNWMGDDALTLIRQNVHFIAVPLMSPDNFVTNPFNGSNRTRSRQNYETLWVEASFVASGTDINITYMSADFPENELHTFANYFQERTSDIEGKTGVTVADSTNTDAVRHNDVYRIKTVVGAGNIILENDISVAGSVSGTLRFCVRADPERNWPTSSWDSFTPGSPTSAPITFYDNKGTKPISTMENANVMDIVQENPDMATLINFHSGSGDYVTYLNEINRDDSFDVLSDIFESLFNKPSDFRMNTVPLLINYLSEAFGIAGSTPEWHSSEPPEVGGMDDDQATELHNWLGNMLHVISFRNINKS